MLQGNALTKLKDMLMTAHYLMNNDCGCEIICNRILTIIVLIMKHVLLF